MSFHFVFSLRAGGGAKANLKPAHHWSGWSERTAPPAAGKRGGGTSWQGQCWANTRGRRAICQFRRGDFQESRKCPEEEGGFVSKVQHSLRTFFQKVSLYPIETEVLGVERGERTMTVPSIGCVSTGVDLESFSVAYWIFRRTAFEQELHSEFKASHFVYSL